MSPIQKWLLFISLCAPLTLQAQIKPYVRMTGGQAFTRAGQNQTIHFSPAYWKTDVASRDLKSPLFGGVSLGVRMPISERWESEVGFGLYSYQTSTQSGSVYQYSSPTFYNMNYNYQIQHVAFMLEGKLLTRFATIYHPYLSAGIGMSSNHTSAYQEVPIQPYAVADPGFRDATQTSASYAVGFGLDVDVAKQWRIGAGYQYSYLGKAKLGVPPTQQTSQTISAGQIKANLLMVQATYSV